MFYREDYGMDSIGRNFMEKTKYKYLDESDQSKGLPKPSLEMEFDMTKKCISLLSPEQFQSGNRSLLDIISQRRSVRSYSSDPMSLKALSYLLWCTQGVKEIKKDICTLRTVPSAGARHAFETFLLINNVTGLKTGLYRYLALEHKLLLVDDAPDICDHIVAACLGQGYVGTANVTFIWAAVPYRMSWRYGERTFRYLHLDAGHVCQNLYLAAETIDYGVCAIAAFDDDALNDVLGLDGIEAFAIYIGTCGKKK